MYSRTRTHDNLIGSRASYPITPHTYTITVFYDVSVYSYYSMDILHMNCYYHLLYLYPKMLNLHYLLLIIIKEYYYSISNLRLRSYTQRSLLWENICLHTSIEIVLYTLLQIPLLSSPKRL